MQIKLRSEFCYRKTSLCKVLTSTTKVWVNKEIQSLHWTITKFRADFHSSTYVLSSQWFQWRSGGEESTKHQVFYDSCLHEENCELFYFKHLGPAPIRKGRMKGLLSLKGRWRQDIINGPIVDWKRSIRLKLQWESFKLGTKNITGSLQ